MYLKSLFVGTILNRAKLNVGGISRCRKSQGQETFPTDLQKEGKMRKYMSVFLTLNSLLLTLNSAVQGDLFKAGISNGWDDAYQAGNSMNSEASMIRTGYHTTSPIGYYYSGFRFQNVTINNGATIDSAFLEMYGGPDIVSNVTSTIYGHKVNNSPNFAYSDDSLHERDSTNANVFWTYDIKDGEWNKTIDIKSIISEITNLSGWSSGNALSIIIHSTDAPEADKRGYWRSYEWSPDSVCTLTVYWTEGSGPDTTAPAPPESLKANGSHPSPWTNDSLFVLSWTNPTDPSNIAKALYKLGTAPDSNHDTTGSLSPFPPDSVSITQESINSLYLWLVDGTGNVDYNNNASVDLRYDISSPDSFSLVSPLDSAVVDTTRPTFGWQSSIDTMSGLSIYGIYIDGSLKDTTPDTTWTMNYDLPPGPHPWYIVAWDSAGNSQQSNETWTVIVDTTVYAPDIDISYFEHDFDTVAIGDSSDWIFKIYNVGNDTLIVDSLTNNKSEYKIISPTFPQPVQPYLPDSFSLDVTIRFKPMVTGIVEDTLNIYSNDPDESILQISLTGTGIGVDTTAPSAPLDLTANGSSPSPWTNDSLFVISWISPYDPSMISKALYKLGVAPDSDYDTTGSLKSISPDTLLFTKEGTDTLWLWLVDGANNVDYQNRAGVILRYDAVQPMGSEAGSPVVSKKTNFTVQWSSGTDIGGSGLSGRYSVKAKHGISPYWDDLLTDTLLTQITFTGEHGYTYYFEAMCHDNAGNIESFTEIAECSTFIDTTSPDTSAPEPPTGVTATGEDRSITILWSPNTEQDLAGYNVYCSAMSDGEYSAVNSHLIVGNWFRDEGLSKDTTLYYVVTAVDNDRNESGYSISDSATTENTSPAPVSEFSAQILEGARIELTWVRSSSYDIYQYNIYCDNETGVINYDLPIDVVYHPSVVWVSDSLTPGQEYKFALRAEDDAENEERNTHVVVTVIPEGTTEGLVKTQIKTPHAGKKIYGNRVTVLAKVVLGDQSEVKCVRFQYKPTFGYEWTNISPAVSHFTNPDSTHPYFVHWDVTVLDSGYYDIMSIATDTAGHPDPNPSYITVMVDPHNWDEQEGESGEKVSEHWKRERVERMCSNQSTLGDGDDNTVTRVIIPTGALEQNTELMTIIRDKSNIPDIGDYKSINEFREVWLENGQEILLSEKEFQIEIPYLDEDNDGIVDETDVPEGDIWLAYYNEIAGKWDSLDSYIDTENNLVFGSNYRMGIYALLGPKITGVQETDENALRFTPHALRLYQNYPNPFAHKTVIRYSVPVGGISRCRYQGQETFPTDFRLAIYDLSGRLVKSFPLPTSHFSLLTSVSWDGTDNQGHEVSSGIYFYQLQAVDKKITKKMVILR